MTKIKYILMIGVVALLGCSPINPKNDQPETEDLSLRNDVHSYSNVDDVATKHLHLDLDVNFDNRTIYGIARHELDTHDSDTIIFDIKKIDIQKVTIGEKNEKETAFIIGKFDSIKGQPLIVPISPDTRFVNIYYQTTEEAEALDWLSPELTDGKKHPFLYTQGQAILTRSWIPLQDTPKNRITYSADVRVPGNLMAVMSASNPTKRAPRGRYHFEMKQKIPAYLIALAVGDLAYVPLGKNCGVYAEPSFIDACAYEFEELPDMITTAEGLYGPYQWDQYDIVMLPYSFPFGGMENPRLTFANPTIVSGDRSLVSVIAHELAHSWSGNLVTNATWNDFWLNEGFTVYFENRIMEEVAGKEVADILAIIEFQDLTVALDDMENGDHPEDTQLKLQLDARNPDDGMTDIAYVKGAYFLRTLEKTVGRKTFDAFLESYFNEHAFETITTEEFIRYLEKELLEPNNITFNTKEWIYELGLPDNCIEIKSSRLEEMKELASLVNEGKDPFKGKYAKMKRTDHITQEWQTFIRNLNKDLDSDQMKLIDNKLEFSKNGNPAIQSDWFLLSVRSGYTDNRQEMEQYLIKIGRRWFIESIYQALYDSDNPDDREWAKMVFDKAKNGYHFVSRSTIEEILY